MVKKDTESNDVFVVRGDDHPALYIDHIKANELVGEQLVGSDFEGPIMCKIRYSQADQVCRVKRDQGELIVEFENAQKGVATGQSIVFYKGNTCLGGGIIDQLGPSHYDNTLNLN